ncbi:ABC transporter ATP-binding protein [Azospirillum doebereinerae]|uniref:ABC transporter ATP-binding protein n=1 Tax=Azospirillum doebereinerae TaxID=92933 RepID=UPI001EE56FCA|nr:ABC transporter ATP-binding protein [Azospirillum doebereinerae]MCG5238441.1 ABC transporter ATP-binding protein [Azospirillum doebereinerae]
MARHDPSKAAASGGNFEALHLDRITRRFHNMVALNELSLTVRRGEFIALLGPSGCGKSTALNCLAGLMPLSGGRIMLDDRRIDTLPPERRGFGMVFQNYALFPHMSVRKNIGFGLMMRNVPEKEAARRVNETLDLVQLQAHADKLPGQLSGGQQQRVAIARAIVVNPPLILMDEPLSNLDAKLRLEMRHEIRRIHHEVQRSTIYVTHDQDEALSLADRIVVMQDGVVQQIGTPEQLYNAPANLNVARFMGYRNVIAFDACSPLDGRRMQVHRNGVTLNATLQGDVAGHRCTVAIRPDDLRIGDPESDPEGANSLDGRVIEVEYCGRDWLVDVDTAIGVLHARIPQAATPGQRIRLVLPADRVLAYPQGRDAAMAVAAE